jgi:predicted secreted protein
MKDKIHVWIVLLCFLASCTPLVTPSIASFSTTPIPTRMLVLNTPTEACLASGNQDDINARLLVDGSVAVLCQGAVFELTGSIMISANHQQIYTEGFPLDERRAVLRIVSTEITTAVLMRDYSDILLGNLIIDGNRPSLGNKSGEALIYAGGYSSGQIIRALKIMEPRSWSALHLIEPCNNALVENNDIGPAGSPDGTWADGISLACTNSIVRNNRIVDATDGAIVVFEATGSIVEANIIRAETRTLLGGIHMVSSDLYGGNYTGTVVRNNSIESAGAVIRIGIPMGPRTWLCLDANSKVNMIYGGRVTNNILRGDKMQYGFIVDGVQDWTVIDNIDESTHIGTPTVDCNGLIATSPAGFQYYPPRSQGVFQPEFMPANLELALWAIKDPVP